MKKQVENQLIKIAKKYSEYGVTLADCITIYNSGIKKGINEKAAVIGVRFALSLTYNVHEIFTSEDVAAVTGETVEQVNRHIEENKDEMVKNGYIIENSKCLPFFPQ